MSDEARLTAWARVQLARHPDRPYSRDYIQRMAPDFVELHGDRMTGDDAALVAGVGRWHGHTTMFFGQQKGRNLADRVAHSWGMMHPEGYRKAMRLARQAAKFGFPIVSLIDTPGAFPGAAAEEGGIASAIAEAIRDWFHVSTPVVAAVVGEGGSGGALGMAVADGVLMFENSIYSVAAPEAAASILWRDANKKAEAAEQLHLTAADLDEFDVIDEVIAEPPGGAHTDYEDSAARLDEALWRHLEPLLTHDRAHMLENRRRRFLRVGHLTDHHLSQDLRELSSASRLATVASTKCWGRLELRSVPTKASRSSASSSDAVSARMVAVRRASGARSPISPKNCPLWSVATRWSPLSSSCMTSTSPRARM